MKACYIYEPDMDCTYVHAWFVYAKWTAHLSVSASQPWGWEGSSRKKGEGSVYVLVSIHLHLQFLQQSVNNA